jgi:plasmid stabilization system protein ParE
MSMPVVWSPSALEEYSLILEYVEENWGLEAALNLLDATDQIISQIQEFPNLFPSSKKKDIRKAVVSKQTSLIYRVTEEQIQILHLWDNRQDPEKFEELLK